MQTTPTSQREKRNREFNLVMANPVARMMRAAAKHLPAFFDALRAELGEATPVWLKPVA